MKPSNQYPIYHYGIKQNTEQWDKIREGKFTASKAEILAVKGKGRLGLGTGAMTHLYKKASEVITGGRSEGDEDKADFSNVHTERGKDYEPLVIKMYEEKTYSKVNRVGFVQYSKHIGCSPDGLVGEDGLIEIKCPDNPQFLKRRLTWEMPKSTWCQINYQLMCTERKWCDYILYNWAYGNIMWVNRITPFEPLIKILRKNALAVEQEIKNMESTMNFLLQNT